MAVVDTRLINPGFGESSLPPFQLSEIGYKIFMDRYALKDHTKKLKVGDIVVADVGNDIKWKQKEPARVVAIYNGQSLAEDTGDDMQEFALETIYGGQRITKKRFELDIPVETTLEDTISRMANAQGLHEFSLVKGPGDMDDTDRVWYDNFSWLLGDARYVPGGRVWSALGTNQNLTMFNCFVIPSPKDSREGIRETLAHKQEIMARGGGVGINLSSLRPRNAYVRGVNGRSSGAVGWGALYSYDTGLIEQGGSRRGALMLILEDWHPDLVEFICSKNKPEKVQYFKEKYGSKFPDATFHAHGIDNANISIGISDAFMEAVKNDREWRFIFPDYEAVPKEEYQAWNGDIEEWIAFQYPVKVYGTCKARDLWELIMESSWMSAEPGVVFLERYNKMANSFYFERIIATNPCGEQGLPGFGVCNLGHINLSRFVVKSGEGWNYTVDWDNLEKAVRLAVRFQDNIIDITPYFTEENRKVQMDERRLGLGTMGLAEMLIRLKLRYGSHASLEFIDALYSHIAYWAYDESAELAGERGAFPMYSDDMLRSGFMSTLLSRFPQLRDRIQKNGIRNVALLTQAPTGSTGTMIGTSTGMEPFFSYTWWRKSRIGTMQERIGIMDEYLDQFCRQGNVLPDGINEQIKMLPGFFVTAMELTPQEHVDVQAAIQKWTDSSISKTTNAPNEYTVNDVADLYMYAYDQGLKGMTIYRDRCRDEQVLNVEIPTSARADDDRAEEIRADEPIHIVGTITAMSGTIPGAGTASQIRKRPSRVVGFTEKIKTPMGKLYVTVNFDDEEPVEVFIRLGKAGQETNAFTEALGRLISTSIKYGIPYDQIVKQLRGIVGASPWFYKADFDEKGQLIRSIADAVGMVLERYLVDDRVGAVRDVPIMAKNVSPEEVITGTVDNAPTSLDLGSDCCPQCGAKLTKIEGCTKCMECSYSKC